MLQLMWKLNGKNLKIQKKLDNMDYNLAVNMKSFEHQLASHTRDKIAHMQKVYPNTNTYPKFKRLMRGR